MNDEKFLEEEMLDDEQLDNVVGGNGAETISDGEELYKRGLLHSNRDKFSKEKIYACLQAKGYSGYEILDFEILGGGRNNIYRDKSGNVISRETFWANFDAENGTSVIR